MSLFAERRKRVLSLARGRQVVAGTSVNTFYLTDFYGAGVSIVREDRTVVVTSKLDEERVKEVGREVEVVAVKRWADVWKKVEGLLGRGEVLVDCETGLRGRRFVRDAGLFRRARMVKDREEVKRIRRASSGIDRVFEALEGAIRPGRTEWEVASVVMRAATAERLTPNGFDGALSPTIIASGENGALPHAELTSRRIRNGDFVIADLSFRYMGYNSDATRTFAVGTVTAEMKRNYAAVLESQLEGQDRVREGVKCYEIDSAARTVLRRHGLEKLLNHGIGHGVGIEIHEEPFIGRKNRHELLKDEVLTVEPGVYLKGRYGVRIEDTVRVGRRSEPLTHYTKELVTVG